MTPEQISQLSTTDLDALLIKLAQERASRPEKVSDGAPKLIDRVEYPGWWSQMGNDGSTLLRLRHPGLGWLNFGFTPETRAQILGLWLHHGLLLPLVLNQAKDSSGPQQAPPPAQSGGGGTVH